MWYWVSEWCFQSFVNLFFSSSFSLSENTFTMLYCMTRSGGYITHTTCVYLILLYLGKTFTTLHNCVDKLLHHTIGINTENTLIIIFCMILNYKIYNQVFLGSWTCTSCSSLHKNKVANVFWVKLKKLPKHDLESCCNCFAPEMQDQSWLWVELCV